jgi:glycosyltransferase involved in cell wall biosynthesis
VGLDEWTFPAFHLKRFWVTLAAIRRLRGILREQEPDIVHVHFLGHAAWYAALSGCRPLVVSVMGGDLMGSTWRPSSGRERFLTPYTLRRSDLVLCWSRNLAQMVKPLLDAGHEPTVLVGGVDLRVFQPSKDRDSLRRDLGVGAGDFLIFSPRLFWPLQNIATIVRAMPHLLRSLPQARLLMVKYLAEVHPEYERSIEELIDELGMRPFVRFVPGIANADMPRYYCAADCTVSIPNTDGTPMTLMESAACGTPAVIHDLPDYDPSFFVHGETVMRVPLRDPELLAEAIVAIAADKRLRDRLVRGARDVVERHANYEAEIGRLEEMYNGLVPGSA